MKKTVAIVLLGVLCMFSVASVQVAFAQSASGSAANGSGIDNRFIPVGGLPQKLLDQIKESQKISINIDGASLRSDVASGKVIVSAWDAKTQNISLDPENIRIKENLNSFAQALILSDPNIINMSINDRTIALKLQTNGKLFGFIPVGFIATINLVVPSLTDMGTGQLQVTFPWYSILMKKQFTASALTESFIAQAQLINSQDSVQKIAQYLSALGTVITEQQHPA